METKEATLVRASLQIYNKSRRNYFAATTVSAGVAAGAVVSGVAPPNNFSRIALVRCSNSGFAVYLILV